MNSLFLIIIKIIEFTKEIEHLVIDVNDLFDISQWIKNSKTNNHDIDKLSK